MHPLGQYVSSGIFLTLSGNLHPLGRLTSSVATYTLWTSCTLWGILCLPRHHAPFWHYALSRVSCSLRSILHSLEHRVPLGASWTLIKHAVPGASCTIWGNMQPLEDLAPVEEKPIIRKWQGNWILIYIFTLTLKNFFWHNSMEYSKSWNKYAGPSAISLNLRIRTYLALKPNLENLHLNKIWIRQLPWHYILVIHF